MKKRGKKGNRLQKKDEIQSLTIGLKKSIKRFLDQHVTNPALQSVDKEFEVQQDIGIVLTLFKITEELIIDHGDDVYAGYLTGCKKEQVEEMKHVLGQFINKPDETQNIKEVDDILSCFINKKHLMSYLVREIKWISVSIISASYISSFVLTRSVFELLIGIATNKMGSMSGRIESINFLSIDEQKSVKTLWNKLNAWAHPYGKWEKEICPVYYSAEPIYHPSLYKECIEHLFFLTDIFLTIAVERFKILPAEIKNTIEKLSANLAPGYFSKLPLFSARLATTK